MKHIAPFALFFTVLACSQEAPVDVPQAASLTGRRGSSDNQAVMSQSENQTTISATSRPTDNETDETTENLDEDADTTLPPPVAAPFSPPPSAVVPSPVAAPVPTPTVTPVVGTSPSPAPAPVSAPAQTLANGKYIIKNVASGFCIDVPASSTTSGTNLQVFTCNGTDAQIYIVESLGSGLFKIRNKGNTLSFQIRGRDLNAGAVIEQAAYSNVIYQQFTLEPDAGSKNFRIKARGGIFTVTTPGDSTSIEMPLEIWPASASMSQRWTFTPVP